MKSKPNYYIVGLILLTFFVISFMTNVIGPLSPKFINDFKLSDFFAGVLPFAFFIAYGVMSIPTSMLVQQYNEKKIMVAAFVVAFAGALLLAAVPNYLTAIISLFLIGCGMAMLQVVINPLLRVAGGAENYATTSVLAQLVFGGASFLSPLVFAYMVKHLQNANEVSAVFSLLRPLTPASMSWISLYWLFTVISLAMFVIMLLSRFPKVELTSEEKAGPWQTHVDLFKKPVVIAYFIALFCYVGTEQGVSYWMSEFLHRYHGFNPDTDGADAVSYFWGLMMAGGILGISLLKLMDSRKLLIMFTIPAMICLSLGLFGSAQVSFYSFAVTGFFMSVMYPVIFSLALSSVSEDHGSFAGILVTGIIGGAVVQLLIGALGNIVGLRAGMTFLYLTFGYMLSIGFWAKPIVVNETAVTAKTIGYVGGVLAGLAGIVFYPAKDWLIHAAAGGVCSVAGFFVTYLIARLFVKNNVKQVRTS